MPAPTKTRQQVLQKLLDTFRREGYDGASLAEISDATGLGKSSLYHHFPKGKQQMATEVLAFLDAALEDALFAPMKSNECPEAKLAAMLAAIDAFYDGGKKACLLERLCASTEYRRFKRPLERAFVKWMATVEALATEAGVDPGLARQRAEDAVVRIEGALIVSAGTGDTGPFARALEGVRHELFRR